MTIFIDNETREEIQYSTLAELFAILETKQISTDEFFTNPRFELFDPVAARMAALLERH